MYEDADIEKEYSLEKAVQRLRKKRLRREIIAKQSRSYIYRESEINADSLAASLKSRCQVVEHSSMTVYAPVLTFK